MKIEVYRQKGTEKYVVIPENEDSLVAQSEDDAVSMTASYILDNIKGPGILIDLETQRWAFTRKNALGEAETLKLASLSNMVRTTKESVEFRGKVCEKLAEKFEEKVEMFPQCCGARSGCEEARLAYLRERLDEGKAVILESFSGRRSLSEHGEIYTYLNDVIKAYRPGEEMKEEEIYGSKKNLERQLEYGWHANADWMEL